VLYQKAPSDIFTFLQDIHKPDYNQLLVPLTFGKITKYSASHGAVTICTAGAIDKNASPELKKFLGYNQACRVTLCNLDTLFWVSLKIFKHLPRSKAANLEF